MYERESGHLKMKKFTITGIQKDSIFEELEVETGDVLLSINGTPVTDYLDYRFAISDDTLLVEIEKTSGEIWELDIEKEFEEDLGILFPEEMLETKTCRNHCIFCFIDQLPAGMRETLYVKDDDERLSFLTGNYITMTNLSDAELERIIRYRIMPMNLSIHTTDPVLRCKMLRNRFAGNVMTYLEKFRDNGIQMNGQIVLVPDYNDGAALNKTLRDLAAFYPMLQSVSVVPVGLSRHRVDLDAIRLLTPKEAEETIEIINQIHWDMQKKHGTGFVYPSDEIFLLANRPLPGSDYYDGFPQIENGVGMITDFRSSVLLALKAAQEGLTTPKLSEKKIGMITGTAAASQLEEMAEQIMSIFPHLTLSVFSIKNHFFGETITVSGLLTGTDITTQLAPRLEKNPQDLLLLPENALRHDTECLLDDWTLKTMQDILKTKVMKLPVSGKALIDILLKSIQNQ